MSKIYPFTSRPATTNCDFSAAPLESEDSPERDVRHFRGAAILAVLAWAALLSGGRFAWSWISSLGSALVVDQSEGR